MHYPDLIFKQTRKCVRSTLIFAFTAQRAAGRRPGTVAHALQLPILHDGREHPGLMSTFPFEGLSLRRIEIRDMRWHHHVILSDWRRVGDDVMRTGTVSWYHGAYSPPAGNEILFDAKSSLFCFSTAPVFGMGGKGRRLCHAPAIIAPLMVRLRL